MGQDDRLTGLVGYSGCKVPVRVATTANITLSGLQTIDGVALAQDDRVLVKDQTDTTKNAIWVADSGDWNRAPDCDGPYDLVKGSLVFVGEGTTNVSNWYYCSTSSPIPDGSMAIAWSRSSTALAVISAFMQGVVAQVSAILARASLGLGITSKGGILAGTGASAIAEQAAGANNTLLGYDSTQTAGLRSFSTAGTLTASGGVLTAGVATQADQETGTSLVLSVTPGRQQYHASACKGWCEATAAGSATASYNVSSVTDSGTGDANINWTTSFSWNTSFMPMACARSDTTSSNLTTVANSTTSAALLRVLVRTAAGAPNDPDQYCVASFGDQ